MKDFRPKNTFGGGGNRGGDRGGFHGGNKFGKRDFGPKEMFDATCAKCGKSCQVPFRPNGERPVYCRDCFVDVKPPNQGQPSNYQRSDAPRREFSAPSAPRQEGGDSQNKQIQELKRQLDIVNTKLDRLLDRTAGDQKKPASTPATTKELPNVKEIPVVTVTKKAVSVKKATGKKTISKKK